MAMKQSTSETPTSIVDPQENHETTPFEFDRLPKEIAVEIMSRMPVESLKQFKLVNKKTHSLIKTLMTNPKFVAKHLHHSSEAANASPTLISSCLIVGPKKGRDYEPIVPLLTLLGNNQGGVEEHRLKSFCIEEEDNAVRLTYDLKVGHCDGIVVLASDRMFLSLCNPALRELVTFFVGSKIDLWSLKQCSWQCPVEGIGIGYDSSSECYKVVRILDVFDFDRFTLRAEVYTLGTRSWREVEIPVSDWKLCFGLSSPVYFQGSCYWLMVDHKILSFEMSSEAFRIVNPPDYQNHETILEPRLRLAMWNGSVCLLCYDKKVGQQSSNYIRKWVMEIGQEDSGHAYTWRECPSIRLEPRIFKAPLTFCKEDELLVSIEDDQMGCFATGELRKDDQMGCYNVATGKLRTVPVFQGERRTLCSNPYVASLVSVKEIIGYGK